MGVKIGHINNPVKNELQSEEVQSKSKDKRPTTLFEKA